MSVAADIVAGCARNANHYQRMQKRSFGCSLPLAAKEAMMDEVSVKLLSKEPLSLDGGGSLGAWRSLAWSLEGARLAGEAI